MESMEGSLYLIVAIVAVLFVRLRRYCPVINVVRQTRFLSCMDGPVRMRPGE